MQDKWMELAEQFEKSNMKQKDWCKQNGISIGTFQYRVRKARSQQLNKTFIEIKSPTLQGLKLQWGRVSLELDPEFDIKTLQRFLRTVDELG